MNLLVSFALFEAVLISRIFVCSQLATLQDTFLSH